MTELPTEEDRSHLDAWQEFKRALCREQGGNLPDYIDAVVLLHLEKLARQEARRFQNPVRHELEDATSFLFEKIEKFTAGIGSPSGWARTVLRRHGKTLDKKQQRQRICPKSKPVEELAERPPEPEPNELDPGEPLQALDLLREPENRLRLMPEVANSVDYYIVFTLEYRLRVAESLREQKLEEPVLERVSQWLTWEDWELVRRVKPVWPEAGRLWSVVLLQDCSSSSPIREPLFAWCNEQIGSSRDRITATKWAQWVKRAKEFIRGEDDPCPPVSAENWQKYFQHLFPDNDIRQHHDTNPEEGR